MNLGMSLTLGLASRSAGVPSYSPLSLFDAGEQGVWYDPSDFSTMYQDNLGVTPVTAVGQTVGRIEDKSGNGNHATQATAASRPILRQTAGGLYYLEFDGTDDFLVTGNIDFSATDEMTVIAGVRKLSDAASASLVELSASDSANAGTFAVYAPSASGQPRYQYRSRGDASLSAAAFTNAAIAAPVTNVVTGLSDISGDSVALRINGAEVATSTNDQGAGNYGAAYPLHIGRRGGVSFPFNGQLYSLIVRGLATAGTDLTDAESYVAGKTGMTL
jgi:hypothetical protein